MSRWLGHRRWRTPRDLLGVLRYEWSMRAVWVSRRAAVRGLWWTLARRYPFEVCTCGRPVSLAIGSVWRADDELWNGVAGWPGWETDLGEMAYLGPPGTPCPRCFTERAERKGIELVWMPVAQAPEGRETRS